MSKGKKIVETVSIECASANVVTVVEQHQLDDTAREIDALDCKSDPQNFERLLRYFITVFAQKHGLTPEKLCELAPEHAMRAALRKAVDRFKPGAYRLTTYASWWFRQALLRYLPPRPPPPLVSKPYTKGEGR